MSADDTLERQFGAYWLLKRIARGGTAEIFRALVGGTGDFTRVVAIKRMLAGLSADPEFADMFIAEAKITSQLDHANIVQVTDFGLVDDLLYLCMEYVQGTTVASLVRSLRVSGRPVPIPEVCTIAIEALYGLDQAHRQTAPTGKPLNIIHRDLSPSNLLVSWEGQVKIGDFGIAKAKALRQRTFTGKIKGKVAYMSPEQAKGEPLDQRSDLFSLGACFYELLTLSQLYPDAIGLQVLDKVQAARFAPPRQRNKAIPHALEAILLRALARDPDQRYQSAAEMRDAIEELMFEVGLRANSMALASLLSGLFDDSIQAEQKEIASEVAAAEPFQTRSAASQPKAVKTFVLRQEDMPPGVSLFGEGPKAPQAVEAALAPPVEPDFPTPPAFPAAEPAPLVPAVDPPASPEPQPALRQPTTEQALEAVSMPPPTAVAPQEPAFSRAETAEIPASSLPASRPQDRPTPIPDDAPLIWSEEAAAPASDSGVRTQRQGAPLGARSQDTQPRAVRQADTQPGVEPTPGDNKPTIIRGQPLPADHPEPDDPDKDLDEDENFEQDFEDDPVGLDDDLDDDLDR